MISAEAEKLKYEKTWRMDDYRKNSPGLRVYKDCMRMMMPKKGKTFTDWGCGSGAVGDRLAADGYDVRMVDITSTAYRGNLPFIEACLWDLPDLGKTEYGYCADVMEHLPPERLDAAFRGIAAHTENACFFQIALFKDHFGNRIGETLHLSVFPARWWAKKIRLHFSRVEFDECDAGRRLLVAAWK